MEGEETKTAQNGIFWFIKLVGVRLIHQTLFPVLMAIRSHS